MTTPRNTQPDVESVVRRYYAVVSEISSSEDDLRPLLSETVTVIEHPNAIAPRGTERGLSETLAGFRAGKSLLQEQAFELQEIMTSGDRAAVRATWTGTVGVEAGPFKAGQRLNAEVAALLTVRDGLIVRHETFDCFQPFDL